MKSFAIDIAVGLPLALIGALLLSWWRQAHPWKPGRMSQWLYHRAERKVAAIHDLSPSVRAERLRRIQTELNTPPEPPRTFGENFKREFLVFFAGIFLAALFHLVLDAPKP
jgi:hypothetical protein